MQTIERAAGERQRDSRAALLPRSIDLERRIVARPPATTQLDRPLIAVRPPRIGPVFRWLRSQKYQAMATTSSAATVNSMKTSLRRTNDEQLDATTSEHVGPMLQKRPLLFQDAFAGCGTAKPG